MKSGTRAKSARSEKTLKAFLSESLKNGAFEVNLLQRRCFLHKKLNFAKIHLKKYKIVKKIKKLKKKPFFSKTYLNIY